MVQCVDTCSNATPILRVARGQYIASTGKYCAETDSQHKRGCKCLSMQTRGKYRRREDLTQRAEQTEGGGEQDIQRVLRPKHGILREKVGKILRSHCIQRINTLTRIEIFFAAAARARAWRTCKKSRLRKRPRTRSESSTNTPLAHVDGRSWPNSPKWP